MVIYLTDPLPMDTLILLLQQGTFPQGMDSEPALGQPGQMKPLPGLLCPTPHIPSLSHSTFGCIHPLSTSAPVAQSPQSHVLSGLFLLF